MEGQKNPVEKVKKVQVRSVHKPRNEAVLRYLKRLKAEQVYKDAREDEKKELEKNVEEGISALYPKEGGTMLTTTVTSAMVLTDILQGFTAKKLATSPSTRSHQPPSAPAPPQPALPTLTSQRPVRKTILEAEPEFDNFTDNEKAGIKALYLARLLKLDSAYGRIPGPDKLSDVQVMSKVLADAKEHSEELNDYLYREISGGPEMENAESGSLLEGQDEPELHRNEVHGNMQVGLRSEHTDSPPRGFYNDDEWADARSSHEDEETSADEAFEDQPEENGMGASETQVGIAVMEGSSEGDQEEDRVNAGMGDSNFGSVREWTPNYNGHGNAETSYDG